MRTILLSALIVSSIASPTSADDWPGWLGPNRDGVSAERGWSSVGRGSVWKRRVGTGYSAPAVVGDRLYTLGHDEETQRDTLVCLHARTGDSIWSASWASKTLANFHGGGTLTTPTVHAGRVYVMHREGRLRCFTAEDGELLWNVDLKEALALDLPFHGFVGCPVILDGRVYVNCGRHTLALDASGGDLVWKSAAFSDCFSPLPLPVEDEGRAGLAVFTGDGLSIFDRGDGSTLRSFPWSAGGAGVNCAAPLRVGDRWFVSCAYNKGGVLLAPQGKDGLEVVWTSRRLRNKINACVFVDGHLYGFDESILKCFDVEGNELWQQRGLGLGSLSAADGRLLILSSKGELIIAAADPTGYRELAKHAVLEGGVYWTPPVLSHGYVYCRNSLGDLVCRDHRPGDTVETTAVEEPAETKALPAAAALFARHLEAIGGAEAIARHRSMRLTGTLQMPGAGGVDLPYRVEWMAPNRWVQVYTYEEFGSITECYDGERAWRAHPWEPSGLIRDEQRRDEMRETSTYDQDVTYAELYPTMQTTRIVRHGDRECWEVAVTSRHGARRRLYFDVATGLCAGRDGEGERCVVLSRYERFDGRLIPTRIRVLEAGTGEEMDIAIERVAFDEVDARAFEPLPVVRWQMLEPAEAAERSLAARRKYAPWLGRYEGAAFGMSEAVAHVTVAQGRPALGFAEQPPMVLEDPDENGTWRFPEVSGFALRFERDEETGAVVALVMTEGEQSFRLERTAGAPVPAADIARDLGIVAEEHLGGRPVLVFLHGWACDRTHWIEQLREFRDQYHLIALDLAGHGDSTVQHASWSAEGLADEVVALLERLDARDVILVGHSMGGTVALAAAARLSGRVVGVIGVDCLHDAEFQVPPAMIEQMVRAFGQDWNGAMQAMAAQSFAGRTRADHLTKIVLRSAQKTDPAVAIALSRSFLRTDFPRLFREAGVPIRCINCADGPWKTAAATNAKYADYSAELLEGVSHWPMLEAPETFHAAFRRAIEDLVGR